MGLFEGTIRTDRWLEGTWIELADGQAWSFPPLEAFPGYDEVVRDAAREIIAELMPLLNFDAVKARVAAVTSGEPADLIRAIRTILLALAPYQVCFRVASRLLASNYRLTEEDLDRLLPFNYQFADFFDRNSKMVTSVPHLGAFNAVWAYCGIDLSDEIRRIAESN